MAEGKVKGSVTAWILHWLAGAADNEAPETTKKTNVVGIIRNETIAIADIHD
jgi:hypothetical protein